MCLDITVTHEASRTRVRIAGEASVGQLMSLLQVLQVDSGTWPHEAALFDLRAVTTALTPAELERLRREAVRLLPRMSAIAFENS